MKRFHQSEIGAAVGWVLGSILMAAVISPWIYQGGTRLAAMTEAGDFSAPLEWLGAACGRAKFGRFFDRSLWLSALVLMPFLFGRLRTLKSRREGPAASPLARMPMKTGALQVLTGFVIAAALLWSLAAVLGVTGASVANPKAPALLKLIPKVLVPAMVVAPLEEWLFRGVLLGLWLRFARPTAACVGTSFLFAIMHFLRPAAGTVIADPGHPLAGIELLGKIFLHFADPLFFITDFATLFVVGLILSAARVRTGALWFSIGLHGGWIVAYKAFNLLYRDSPDHPLRPWGVGDSLYSGILPLVTLGLTAVVCHFVLRRFEANRPPF